MSGIFGIFTNGKCNNDMNKEYLRKMSLWNTAYGDSAGDFFESNNISMGGYLEHLNKNLEIINPVIETETYIATIDAVLYNRKDILDRFEHHFSENVSDEKLLLSYITAFGFDALETVNGDFSGAVYNKADNSITLFRDHMGVRPLFYYADDNFFAFSTDIRGIIAIQSIDIAISEEWIYKILGGYFVNGTENTEYENIFCVKPGSYSCFMVSDNKINKSTTTYWSVGRKKIKLKSDEEYQKKLRELIEDSVKIRTEAVSSKVGAELSGGLDSSVIDVIINRLGKECVYYSWSRSPEELEMADNDERLIIKDICDQEGISCNYGYLNLREDSIFADKYQKTGASLDFDEMLGFRYALPPYINTMKIAQTASDIRKLGASVVFSGHGGDEGVSHRCNEYEMFHYKEFYHYFRYVFSKSNGKKHRVWLTLKECYYNLTEDRKELTRPFIGGFKAPNLLNKEFADKMDPSKMPLLTFSYDPIEYIKDGGSRNRLDNVALLGAYGGARYMVPYVDHRVIDFAVSIPRYQYLRGRKDRYIFREAFKDIMPASLYRLRRKETMSLRNVKENPNWFEGFDSDKKTVISKLDRKFWEKYLDFEAVDKFRDAGKPEGEERQQQDSMYYCLYMLALAQNVIDKVRA